MGTGLVLCLVLLLTLALTRALVCDRCVPSWVLVLGWIGYWIIGLCYHGKSAAAGAGAGVAAPSPAAANLSLSRSGLSITVHPLTLNHSQSPLDAIADMVWVSYSCSCSCSYRDGFAHQLLFGTSLRRYLTHTYKSCTRYGTRNRFPDGDPPFKALALRLGSHPTRRKNGERISRHVPRPSYSGHGLGLNVTSARNLTDTETHEP